MMFLTSSILLGFIRLCFIILFLFYLNRKFVNVSRHLSFLDFIICNWFRYGSITLLVIFSLIQLNAYNLFNCLFVMLIITVVDGMGIKNLRNLRQYFHAQIKDALLNFLKDVETNKTFWSWFALDRDQRKTKRQRNNFILVLTVIIGGITFLSRYYFILYDNYSLSDAWIYDLTKVIQSDLQIWFGNEVTVDGEFALVNFYAKITDVSTEIALQVVAILESTLLALIIFWIIHKLTPSKFLAPIIASLAFALVYVLTPLNVYFLLKANPLFFALTLALPAFVFFLKPNALKTTKLSYFLSFFVVFIAIGLIDLFTICILVPPFILIGLFFTKYQDRSYKLSVVFALIAAALVLCVIYGIACYWQRTDLLEFFQASLLSVSSYTYVPQLIMPYDEIIRFVQYTTFGGLLLMVILAIVKKENWRSGFVFIIYFNFLIALTYVSNEWLDVDMLKNSLSVFIPVLIGLNLAVVIHIFNFVLGRFKRFTPITVTAIIAAMIYASIFYQQKNINSLTVSDQTPKQILDAYDKISQSFFPFSYCVVNDPETQVISTNKHFFMNYDFFLSDYLAIDSINFKHRKDPKFLIKHPEYSISKSILVFVLNDSKKKENNIYSLNKQLSVALLKEIAHLRKRGRKINLFYKSHILDVYEIVNEPNESKISDLIF